jgi:TolB-like protein/DNA-binding winged helix-turn-helix (wHTH) protein
MIRQPHGYLFGVFEIVPEAGELRRGGEIVHLEPRVLHLLVYLIEHRERLVPKSELLDVVWDESFVTENALTKAVGRLRRALDDDAQNPSFIHTHHTLGYRFIADVEERADTEAVRSAPEEPSEGSARGRRRWLLGAAGGLAVLVLVAVLIGVDRGASRDRSADGEAVPDIRSLAVLPLANLTGAADQDYVAEGLQEALITDLSKMASLRVISRQSMMRYRGSEKGAPEIARELGVDALVEGSVMRYGDRVGIWAQLIHGASDRHLWAQGYEREAEDVLVLINEVARTISSELRISLTPEQDRSLATAKAVDPAVHDAYLKARYHRNQFTRSGLTRARELFRSALDLDPTFAPAHAGLGATYLLAAIQGEPARQTMPAARAAALEAISLDDQLAEAWVVLGWVRLSFEWDWPEAGRAFRRALELNPSNAQAHHGYADYLTVMGRVEEGFEHVLEGRDCDPLSPLANLPVPNHLSMLRRPDRVIVESRKLLELFPESRRAQTGLGWALYSAGQYEEGLAQLRKAGGADPSMSDAAERGFAEDGPRGAALALAERLVARAESRYVDPRSIAANYARAGEIEAALRWLERAYEDRSPLLVLIKVNPAFDSLRTDPRFEDLLRRIGLP